MDITVFGHYGGPGTPWKNNILHRNRKSNTKSDKIIDEIKKKTEEKTPDRGEIVKLYQKYFNSLTAYPLNELDRAFFIHDTLYNNPDLEKKADDILITEIGRILKSNPSLKEKIQGKTAKSAITAKMIFDRHMKNFKRQKKKTSPLENATEKELTDLAFKYLEYSDEVRKTNNEFVDIIKDPNVDISTIKIEAQQSDNIKKKYNEFMDIFKKVSGIKKLPFSPDQERRIIPSKHINVSIEKMQEKFNFRDQINAFRYAKKLGQQEKERKKENKERFKNLMDRIYNMSESSIRQMFKELEDNEYDDIDTIKLTRFLSRIRIEKGRSKLKKKKLELLRSIADDVVNSDNYVDRTLTVIEEKQNAFLGNKLMNVISDDEVFQQTLKKTKKTKFGLSDEDEVAIREGMFIFWVDTLTKIKTEGKYNNIILNPEQLDRLDMLISVVKSNISKIQPEEEKELEEQQEVEIKAQEQTEQPKRTINKDDILEIIKKPDGEKEIEEMTKEEAQQKDFRDMTQLMIATNEARKELNEEQKDPTISKIKRDLNAVKIKELEIEELKMASEMAILTDETVPEVLAEMDASDLIRMVPPEQEIKQEQLRKIAEEERAKTSREFKQSEREEAQRRGLIGDSTGGRDQQEREFVSKRIKEEYHEKEAQERLNKSYRGGIQNAGKDVVIDHTIPDMFHEYRSTNLFNNLNYTEVGRSKKNMIRMKKDKHDKIMLKGGRFMNPNMKVGNYIENVQQELKGSRFIISIKDVLEPDEMNAEDQEPFDIFIEKEDYNITYPERQKDIKFNEIIIY